MSTKATYRRLPGRTRKNFGFFTYDRHRLWIANDHLLFLRVRPYSERAKRFYFRDIQALAVCPTKAGRSFNMCLGVAAFFTFFIASSAAFDPYAIPWVPHFFGALGIALSLCLGINTLFGPTCTTHLITAVQTQRIYSLGRTRIALRVTGELLPLIQAAQGSVSNDELQQQRHQAQEEAGEVGVVPPPQAY